MKRWWVAVAVGSAAIAALACGGSGATDATDATDATPADGAPTDATPTDGAPTDGDAGDDDGGDKDKVVVVPVDDVDAEHYCCAYAEDGSTKHALTKSPAECNSRFGSKDARWVEGPECIPCCCKSPKNADDPSAGSTYELITPGECAPVGQCVTDDVPECPRDEDKDGDDKDKAGDPKPKPQPQPRPANPRPRPAQPRGGKQKAPTGAKPRQ